MRISSVRFSTFLLFFTIFASHAALASGSVWIGQAGGAFKIDSDTAEIIASISTSMPIDALQIEQASGRVWFLSNNMLYRYSASGTLELEIVLPVDGGRLANLLVIDEPRNKLWVADAQNVFQYDESGQLIGSWNVAPDQFIFGMALDAAGALWLGGDTNVWHLSGGALSLAFSTPDLATYGLDVDSTNGDLWLVGGHGARRYMPGGELLADIELPTDFGAMRVVKDINGAWVAGMYSAARISNDAVAVSIHPFSDVTSPWGSPVSITNIIGSAPPGNAWMSAANHVRLFSPDGTYSKDLVIPGAHTVWQLAEYHDTSAPEIAFDFPPDHTNSNNPQPDLGFSFTDVGSGVNPDTLSVTLDAQPLAVTCQTSPNSAICKPDADIADGTHYLIATVADHAGNIAVPAELNLAIDTVPPVAPDAQSINVQFENGVANISAPAGSVEPGAGVTVRNLCTDESVKVTAGLDGSFDAVLAGEEGDVFEITVADSAGNISVPVERDTGEVVLPPDPIDIAPPLSETSITPFHEAVSFLYEGPNPIQFDVEPETMEPRRLVVLRGKVMTREGEPLAGAKVTINKHPEYGYTLTRADGVYDLAVNGGGYVTINVEKEGYLPAQRTERTPWRDYVIVEDVALVELDPLVTTVNLAALTEIAVAQGSVVQDGDGIRQATIIVLPGTSATMTLPDGTQQSLSTINIRATEYTVGENGPAAMPGELPPTTAYTYAVELSVDEAIAAGATRMDFSQPLPFYVDNFLNFPAGTTVPLGWYDRERAVWVPSDSGKVINILGETADGLAEIDSDGDGESDDTAELAALNMTDEERRKLAELYSVGDSLWRVRISHFTPWDCNWPYGPPDNAEQPPPLEDEKEYPDSDEGDCKDGCVIEAQRQVLGEDVPIAGTPYSLHYRSDRVAGRKTGRRIALSLDDGDLPDSVERIIVKLDIAGRHETFEYPPAVDQAFEYEWDGLDAFGREVNGPVTANIRIGYEYEASYQETDVFGYAGNGVAITGDRARETVVLWRTLHRRLAFNTVNYLRGAGWSVTPVHVYDMHAGTLYLGDGTVRSAKSMGGVIETLAGNGLSSHPDSSNGDGGPAIDASVRPRGLDIMADGSVVFADYIANKIRRIRPDGIIETIAGTGEMCSALANECGDGGLAISARIRRPVDVAIGPDGSIYLVEERQVVRRIRPDGIIEHFAGTGIACTAERLSEIECGDGGPAAAAFIGWYMHGINYPVGDIDVAPDGTVYIAGHRGLRKIDTNGVISTFETPPYPLDVPVAIHVIDNDEIYMTLGSAVGSHQYLSHWTSADGFTIIPIASDEIQSLRPHEITTSPTGKIYWADYAANRLFTLTKNKEVQPVAGDGLAGTYVENSPALSTQIYHPRNLVMRQDGALMFTDWTAGNRIGIIEPVLPGFTNDEVVVASEHGTELYVFDATGRHLGTVDARTGRELFSFEYGPDGYLLKIMDRDRRETTLSYQTDSILITAPDGQQTILHMSAEGDLERIVNLTSETWQMAYHPGSLLATFTTPNEHTYNYTYDSLGRFIEDEDPVDGGWTVSRTEYGNGYIVTMISAEGRTETFNLESQTDGGRKHTNTAPDGTVSEMLFNPDASVVSTAADGTVSTLSQGPDPRFGMQAPVIERMEIVLPSGLTSIMTTDRDVVLADPEDLLSLQTQTDSVTVNGKTTVTVYDAAAQEAVTTTPENRTSMVRIDARGRPVFVQPANFAETAYTYTPEGRMETITVGTGANARVTSFIYYASGPSKGWLETVTDAENRTVSYEYDLAGRATKQILPDLREIAFGYDANGNLTSVTPPGRPAYTFTFTPVDQEDGYTPPDVLPGSDATDYAYNLDKQIELVTRPDSQTIDFEYGLISGKLDRIVTPSGNYDFAYDATTGQLETLIASGGETLQFGHDGALIADVTWSGTVSGSVGYRYNADFRTASIDVDGSAVTFAHDDDGLLVQAGDLVLNRDVVNGLLDTTSLGLVTTDNNVNIFGELDVFTAAVSGSDIYVVDFERDKLGRITHKAETVEGMTTNYDYTYDLAGRLDTVTGNGVQIADYGYDSNGNRTHINGIKVAIYDDQDRLRTYQDCDYGYTDNGELDQRNCNGVVLDVDYDVLGNLRHAVLPDGTQIDYVVDGQNRRVGKKVNGVLVQGFLYQNQLEPVAELDVNNNVIARFVYAEMPHVPSYMLKDGNTYRIISDHLGSVRLVIDTATGEIAQRLDYDEWGNVTEDTNPGFQPFGFAGGVYDRDTGLVRFGTRDYDPTTGRWTAKDPILFAGGINHYEYANSDPINFFDPTGLKALCDALKELAGGAANNPFLNGSPFDKDNLASEHVPEGGGPGDTSHFTDHRNGLAYDVQYAQVGWSITQTYGPGAADLAATGYAGGVALANILPGVETNSGYFNPSNLGPNFRGLHLGQFGAMNFPDFPSFVDDLCPEECKK